MKLTTVLCARLQVLAYLNHFQGDNSTTMVNEVLAKLGMHAITSLSQLHGLKVGDAKKLADGKALAITCADCVAENYDSSIECYKPFYDPCWHSENTAAWTAFWIYMDRTSAMWVFAYSCSSPHFAHARVHENSSPSSDGKLTMVQAHWQEGAEDVATGVLTGKSLLLDESDSKQNERILQELRKGRFPSINLLELNNVCDGGFELMQWLRSNRTR